MISNIVSATKRYELVDPAQESPAHEPADRVIGQIIRSLSEQMSISIHIESRQYGHYAEGGKYAEGVYTKIEVLAQKKDAVEIEEREAMEITERQLDILNEQVSALNQRVLDSIARMDRLEKEGHHGSV
jgi:hypothetical protein